MKLNDTYNVHKKINSIFPFFKSKYLCKKGIHNFALNVVDIVIPHYYQEEDYERKMMVSIVERYEHISRTNLKCLCCGKEIELDGEDGIWDSNDIKPER
jgi:hypothetical protein